MVEGDVSTDFLIRVKGAENLEDFREIMSRYPEFPIVLEGQSPLFTMVDSQALMVIQEPKEKIVYPYELPHVEELDQLQSIADDFKARVEAENPTTLEGLREIYGRIKYEYHRYLKHDYAPGKFSRDLVNLFEESVATLRGSERKMTKTKVPSYIRVGDALTPREIRVMSYLFGLSDEKVSADLIEKVEGLNSLGQSLGAAMNSLSERMIRRMERPWTTRENLG